MLAGNRLRPIRARPTRSSRPTDLQGRRARGHHDQLHAFRPFRLADDRFRHQEVRLGRQEDRGRLDNQRRRQRAVLQELANQGIKAEDIPVVAFSVGEEELAGLDTGPLVGHLAAWNYFQSVDNPANAEFIETGRPTPRTTSGSPTTQWKAHYIGFNMWLKAVRRPHHGYRCRA